MNDTMTPQYAELQVTSNFSFLRGASHPEELVQRAAQLGHCAISITDRNTLAGVVRGHAAAREQDIQYVVGCCVELLQTSHQTNTLPLTLSFLVYPIHTDGYAALSKLLTVGKRRGENNECLLYIEDFLSLQKDCVITGVPPVLLYDPLLRANEAELSFLEACKAILDTMCDHSLFSIALTKNYGHQNCHQIESAMQIAGYLNVPLTATNDVHYHSPKRKPLQDVVTCIREKTTIEKAGFHLFPNAERCLKSPREMCRLFREFPAALRRTTEIAESTASFSLHDLHYEYPHEICLGNVSPLEHLRQLSWQGAHERYPEAVPLHVQKLIRDELTLIHELQYEKYFLTCYDIVRFARERNILCQGRGAAANSAVCYCLGITAVDPDQIDLLFARFVSKERHEPPDIDIDFEHERREEVIQYIYEKYGRHRAALTCEVITYRHRSALREVGKALGLPLPIVDSLAKSLHHWTHCTLPDQALIELGLSPESILVKNTLSITNELLSFPRHLSQHVGGFIISEEPLSHLVPIRNARMEERTIIEWDKDDIEELGMLKIDVLGLGMLTCIRKALDLVNEKRILIGEPALELHTIPREDSAVYDMICAADTIGVFQIESRAQMSMLPRLKPRCFYDLVIEVAIVRPGPIQGNMVHPFLKRRAGLEKPIYPDKRAEEVLGKTLGVPIFQEQAMRLAIELAGFAPGEAEKLRRAMAAWRKSDTAVAKFEERIVHGMKRRGYGQDFAQTCVQQLKGFSEYGFPESHAASFCTSRLCLGMDQALLPG